jgi:O-antigen/teichoic acid export membrane protein
MLAVAIAARALPARHFGVLVLLQSAVLMLRALATFSTQQPVIKLGADAQAAGDRERLGAIISMGLVVDMVASLLAFAVAALCIELSRSAIGLADQDVGSAWILAGSLLLTGYPTSNGIFRLYDRFGALSLVQTLSAVGMFAAYAVLYFTGAELQAFVWAWGIYLAVSSLWQLGVSLALLRRDQVPVRLRMRPFSGPDGRTLLHYCWSTWGTSTAETVRTNGDSLLIGAIVSIEAAGVYNVARQLAGILRRFNVVYTSTVFPEISRLAARGENAATRRLKNRLLSVSALIGLAAIIVAVALGRFVIEGLFGPRFELAYWPLMILIAAAVTQVLGQISSMYVQVYVGPTRLVPVYGAATTVFLASAIPLTFATSIIGMALAQFIFGLALILLCELSLQGTAVSRRSTGE